MNVNEAGEMIEKWYFELENKFSDIKCHAMVVMPNHFHCIIENTGAVSDDVVHNVYDDVSIDIPDNGPDAVGNVVPVGADLRVRPENDNKIIGQSNWGEHHAMDEQSNWGEHHAMDEQSNWGEHHAMDEQSNWGEHHAMDEQSNWGEHHAMDEQTNWGEHHSMDEQSNWGEHIGSPLWRVVQWFKTMTINEYIHGVKNLGWKPFNGKL